MCSLNKRALVFALTHRFLAVRGNNVLWELAAQADSLAQVTHVVGGPAVHYGLPRQWQTSKSSHWRTAWEQ